MPDVFELINFDTLYGALKTDKILLNDIDVFATETKEMLDNLIIKNYSEDNLSVIPSCQCGELKDEAYVGDVCGKCKTTVVSGTDANVSFLLWLKKPIGVDKFISPIMLSILVNRYKITKPNVSLIKYIMVPNYVIDRRQQKKNIGQLERLDYLLESNGIKKGYNGFIQNFFKILDILDSEFVKGSVADRKRFNDFVRFNQDKIFSDYLPFPNKIMFAMDSNEFGRIIDKALLNPINVIRRVTGIDIYTKPAGVKQTKVAKSLLDLADFYSGYRKTTIFSKLGLIRQHISSARSHFTARAVVTSIPQPHVYNEIYLPWSLSCSLLREHILNRLYARNYSYKQAINFLTYHNKIYHPLLDEIFREIVAANNGGMDAIFIRNPGLHRGSVQAVRITRIKVDPGDNTISMSYLIGKSFNGDFDGDEYNLHLVTTERVRKHLSNFEPHNNILNLNGPNTFSNCLSFPKTITSTLYNWFYH